MCMRTRYPSSFVSAGTPRRIHTFGGPRQTSYRVRTWIESPNRCPLPTSLAICFQRSTTMFVRFVYKRAQRSPIVVQAAKMFAQRSKIKQTIPTNSTSFGKEFWILRRLRQGRSPLRSSIIIHCDSTCLLRCPELRIFASLPRMPSTWF